MTVENLNPLELSHVDACVETLRDMHEFEDLFARASLERIFGLDQTETDHEV